MSGTCDECGNVQCLCGEYELPPLVWDRPHEHIAKQWDWTLAHNLAIGAALSRAFNLGSRYETARAEDLWWSGCGCEAP